MPLNDDALTDVASVRLWIGEKEAEAESLEDAINGVSRSIHHWTGRQFVPTEDAVAKLFTYDGDGTLDLTKTELRAVTTITVYSDLPTAQQLVLSPVSGSSEADYRLEPRGGTAEGTYLRLVLPKLAAKSSSTTGYEPDEEDKQIEIRILGNWGADRVPGDVKLAANEAAADAFRNPEALVQKSLGGAGAGDEEAAGLSKRVRNRLRPHKRENAL